MVSWRVWVVPSVFSLEEKKSPAVRSFGKLIHTNVLGAVCVRTDATN